MTIDESAINVTARTEFVWAKDGNCCGYSRCGGSKSTSLLFLQHFSAEFPSVSCAPAPKA